jgi:hypothetical protein
VTTIRETLLANAQQYRGLASTYRAYGEQFEHGSLGRIGNDLEADKYDRLATQQGVIAHALGGTS